MKMGKIKLTKNQKEWLEIAVYIFIGYLIAVGANKGLSFALHTNFPVIAVVSGSMEHNNPETTFYPFMESKSFTMEQIKHLPFSDGMRKGDIVFVQGVPFEKLKAGDVIVYVVPGKEPIIHRIVEKNSDGLMTKGDNNMALDQAYGGIAPAIKPEYVRGKAVLHVPLLGYVKIVYMKITGK